MRYQKGKPKSAKLNMKKSPKKVICWMPRGLASSFGEVSGPSKQTVSGTKSSIGVIKAEFPPQIPAEV
jgi:hypothetical protein